MGPGGHTRTSDPPPISTAPLWRRASARRGSEVILPVTSSPLPMPPLLWIDAFASGPFAGNPAAVCLLERPAPEGWMQALAAELGLSETAFLVPEGEAFGLRWFTPAAEVDLCGHATLASAHALWEEGQLAPGGEAHFRTKSGLLTARHQDGLVWLDFPSTPPMAADPPEGLLAALGLSSTLYTGRSRFDVLVEVAEPETVHTLMPDVAALREVDTRGVIVTARGEGKADFVSRFFAPRVGVDEDPVTGSAHCALAPYWRGRLGRDALRGHQVSARGGIVEVRVRGDRVDLGGRAVTIFRGALAHPPPETWPEPS
jgi:PhzF family phenazine biosynthesis protein